MRRVRHLSFKDYIVPVGRTACGMMALSNEANILLKKTWSTITKTFSIKLHASFETNAMEGVSILGKLLVNDNLTMSEISEFKIYRIDETDWSETFIDNVPAVEETPGVFSGYIDQSALGLNELSGREVYKITCIASRKRKSYKAEVYFNHLGCFDSLIRLRRYAERLDIIKVDE